ncbi:hypothetical protein [Acidovorax sp.]|uniref:hypothetical protein n=1 Tax=Acidovorax sp. TaxID=1872122 RepID=UPI00391F616B
MPTISTWAPTGEEREALQAHLVEASPDGKTVWVHSPGGSTVGRFSKVFGMDVHTTFEAQRAGAGECLHCTHVKPNRGDWLLFCELIERHYGIAVDVNLIEI